MLAAGWSDELARDGYWLTPPVFPEAELAAFRQEAERLSRPVSGEDRAG